MPDEPSFDLERTCPICGEEMEYRPIRLWTGMRYQTNVHEWLCYGRPDTEPGDTHTVKLSRLASQEFKEWEKRNA